MLNLMNEIERNINELRLRDDDYGIHGLHYKMTCLHEELGELAHAIYTDTNVIEECADNIVVILQFVIHNDLEDKFLTDIKELTGSTLLIGMLHNMYFASNRKDVTKDFFLKLVEYQGILAQTILDDTEKNEIFAYMIVWCLQIMYVNEVDLDIIVESIYRSAKKLR